MLAGICYPAVFSVCKDECLFLKLCVCVCVCFVCVYVLMCVLMHLLCEGQRLTSSAFLWLTSFLRQSLTEPGDYVARLSGRRFSGTLLCSPSCTEITNVLSPWLFTWVLVIQTQHLILQSSHVLVPVLILIKAYSTNAYKELLLLLLFSGYYTSDLRFLSRLMATLNTYLEIY